MGRLVVAIDFGTSRTAFAITHEGLEKEKIEVDVPQGAGTVSPEDAKTPTNILLSPVDNSALSFGYTAEAEYVNQIGKHGLFFRWFKMHLYRPSSDDPLIEAANGKKVKLSLVWEKSVEFVMNAVIRKLNREKGIYVSASEIIWVLTVPAIWNDWAKSMIRKAAYDAGMISEIQSENLLLALEPECVYLSIHADETVGIVLDVAQKIMIVDCGGGTVDITAHEITSNQPLELKELIAPDGDEIGAIKVDNKFFDFFSELIGYDTFQRLRRTTAFLSLTRNWEERKVNFSGADEQSGYSHIHVGDVLCEMEITTQEWTELVAQWNCKHPEKHASMRGKAGLALSPELMMSFFEDPIRQIVRKVANVVSQNRNTLKGLSYIVLAGGFARCPIFVDHIHKSFQHAAPRIVVSDHPDLAIVKGAAAFGARKGVFQSRKAKYTYGVSAAVLFDPLDIQHRIHENKKYLAADGKWRIHVFSVHGRVGDDISERRMPYRAVYHPITEGQNMIGFEILVTKSRDVFLDDEDGVQELCRCSVHIDKSLPYECRRYRVEFSFSGTETTCRIDRFNGSEYIHEKDMNTTFTRQIHWVKPWC